MSGSAKPTDSTQEPFSPTTSKYQQHAPMTKLFNDQWQCPNCHVKHGKETLFKQWARSKPELDSSQGFVIYDADFWVHLYKTHGTRKVQCMMMVEVKTYGAKPDKAQDDTLGLVDQMMRNRESNIDCEPIRRQVGGLPLAMFSNLKNEKICCRVFGVHYLIFEKDGPQNSDWIKWDNHVITEAQLVDLLTFNLDPDHPNQLLDLRIPEEVRYQPWLF